MNDIGDSKQGLENNGSLQGFSEMKRKVKIVFIIPVDIHQFTKMKKIKKKLFLGNATPPTNLRGFRGATV